MRRFLTVLFVMSLVIAAAGPVTAVPSTDPINVLGPWTIGSAEGDAFVAELAASASSNRAEVTYESYLDTAELIDRVTGEDPPDLIISPQPGTLIDLAENLVDLQDFVNPVALRRDFGDYLIDVVTVDDAVLGGPIKLDLKTLVWYQPSQFAAAGYEVPQTFDELVALSNEMVADGNTPWCNYIGSGFATGWVGTDWVEDLLLGAAGPTVYDQWVDHAVLFTDPRVETAFERYQQMIDTPGYVFDRGNVIDVPFPVNAAHLDEGGCLMHKQATFFAFFLRDFGADINEFATFKFPSVDPPFGDSVIGAGNYVAALNDRKEVRQLTRFMLSHRFGREALAESGGWLLPNVRFDTSHYPNDLVRSWAGNSRAALLAEQFRFDGSDLMPSVVGAGTFWAGIVDLVAGVKTIPQILSDIDGSWPS